VGGVARRLLVVAAALVDLLDLELVLRQHVVSDDDGDRQLGFTQRSDSLRYFALTLSSASPTDFTGSRRTWVETRPMRGSADSGKTTGMQVVGCAARAESLAMQVA